MGTKRGPSLSRDNLVFCYDAGDKNSYVNGSLTWYNLAASSGNGSLTVSGPKFNSSNGGNLIFNGVDDSVPVSTVFNLGNTFTICSFIKMSGTNTDTSILGSNGNSSNNWFGINNNKTYISYTGTGDGNSSSLTGVTSLANNTYYHVCATVNGFMPKLYVNGVQDTGKNESFTIANWSGSYAIGKRSFSSSEKYFSGSISHLCAYNRVLSDAEILNNYNVMKKRYDYTISSGIIS